MKKRWSLWMPIAVGILAAACTITRVSDTGYVGTWSRGSSVGTSTISIAKTGDTYRFFWKQRSADRKWTADCDRNSHCIEVMDGIKIAEYQFTTRVDPATGHLIVEGDLSIFDPKGAVKEKRRDVDELILEPGNLKLGSYTFERNGVTLTGDERPQRHFDKVSNSVAEPGA
jgi:hypothetical protein